MHVTHLVIKLIFKNHMHFFQVKKMFKKKYQKMRQFYYQICHIRA